MNIITRFLGVCLVTVLLLGTLSQSACASPTEHGAEHVVTLPVVPPPAAVVPPLHFRTVIPDTLPNTPTSPNTPQEITGGNPNAQDANTPNSTTRQ